MPSFAWTNSPITVLLASSITKDLSTLQYMPRVSTTVDIVILSVSAAVIWPIKLNFILGGMDDVPINTHKKSRKRKPSPEPDGHSSSPPRTRFSSYRSGKSASSGYEDTSSDGPIDDGPAVPDSDDLLFSPKKKAKMSGAFGITPAIDKMGRMEVHSGADDFAFDNSFDNVDMDAFVDVD